MGLTYFISIRLLCVFRILLISSTFPSLNRSGTGLDSVEIIISSNYTATHVKYNSYTSFTYSPFLSQLKETFFSCKGHEATMEGEAIDTRLLNHLTRRK